MKPFALVLASFGSVVLFSGVAQATTVHKKVVPSLVSERKPTFFKALSAVSSYTQNPGASPRAMTPAERQAAGTALHDFFGREAKGIANSMNNPPAAGSAEEEAGPEALLRGLENMPADPTLRPHLTLIARDALAEIGAAGSALDTAEGALAFRNRLVSRAKALDVRTRDPDAKFTSNDAFELMSVLAQFALAQEKLAAAGHGAPENELMFVFAKFFARYIEDNGLKESEKTGLRAEIDRLIARARAGSGGGTVPQSAAISNRPRSRKAAPAPVSPAIPAAGGNAIGVEGQ